MASRDYSILDYCLWVWQGGMTRMRVTRIFAIILLRSLPMFCQESQTASAFLGDMSPERLNSIVESRRLAREELAQQSSIFETPNIAIALRFPIYLIVIGKVTGVRLPDGATIPRTRIRFHVEKVIRGNSQVADFDVESQWASKAATQNDETSLVTSMHNLRAFDTKEPRVGDRYILGIAPAYRDEKLVPVPSVIDLQDSNQAALIATAERFLAIEASAERSGFAPYIAALDDKTPWIRDIALYRLTSSEACNASPSCAERFSDVVKRQLQSSTPNERQQAVGWLVWVDSVSRVVSKRRGLSDGMPVLPDSAIRSLFDAATHDENAEIGDEAFQYRESSDLDRGPPGECFTIVPAVRKTFHSHAAKQNPLPPGFPLVYTYGCTSREESGK
jgi:hypothetical protein